MSKKDKSSRSKLVLEGLTPGSVPETAQMQDVLAGLERGGEALRPVFQAIKARYPQGTLEIKDWHIDDPNIPEWERRFEDKYGEIYATVLAAARHHKLDSQLWLQTYFEACEANGWKAPANIEEYLPWNFWGTVSAMIINSLSC